MPILNKEIFDISLIVCGLSNSYVNTLDINMVRPGLSYSDGQLPVNSEAVASAKLLIKTLNVKNKLLSLCFNQLKVEVKAAGIGKQMLLGYEALISRKFETNTCHVVQI